MADPTPDPMPRLAVTADMCREYGTKHYVAINDHVDVAISADHLDTVMIRTGADIAMIDRGDADRLRSALLHVIHHVMPRQSFRR